MNKEITDGFVNQRIMDFLNKKDYNWFYDNYNDTKRISFEVEFIFQSRYKFRVHVEIDKGVVEKDKEYWGTDIYSRKGYQFKILARGERKRLLQDLIDDYLHHYEKWLYECDQMNDTYYTLNEKMR